jgi:hypothetical protein
VHSELSEEIEGIHDGNPKINFMLAAKRRKIIWTYNKEMGGKHETVTGQLA